MILDCLVSSRITAIHNNIVKNPNWSFTSVAEATVEKLQVLLRSYLSGTRALDGTTGASSSRARCLPSFQPSMYVDLSLGIMLCFRHLICGRRCRAATNCLKVPKIMPPKSFDGDSARAPEVSRASDGKGPFNE